MRFYLGVVILKFRLEEQVVLLYSHMTRLVRGDKVLSLALTTDPGNLTFQLLIFVNGTITNRLTFAWSLKLECFSIKLQEPCPFTMSLIK